MLNKFQKIFCLDKLHFLFLFIALPISFSYVFSIYPLQSNDEWGHFLRSIDVTYGNITDTGGIKNGSNTPTVEGPDSIVPFIASPSFTVDGFESTDSPRNIRSLKDLRWSESTVRLTDPFAVYPPISYLFSAIGVGIGRATNSTFSSLLYFGRLSNCIFSIFCFTLAIIIAKKSKLFLFFILSLPSTLSLIASFSQDAFLLSISAITVASISRIKEESCKKYISIATFGLVLMVLIRPHYIFLMPVFIMFLLTVKKDWGLVFFVVLACLIPSVAWYLYVSPIMIKKMFPGVDEVMQLKFVTSHPAAYFNTMINSLNRQWRTIFTPYFSRFVVAYTWSQVLLATTSLLIIIQSLIGIRNKKEFFKVALLVLLCVISVFFVCLTAYVSWTPVGGESIDGIQGRYFLPAVMFLALIPHCLKRNVLNDAISISISIFLILLILVLVNFASLILVTKYFIYR